MKRETARTQPAALAGQAFLARRPRLSQPFAELFGFADAVAQCTRILGGTVAVRRWIRIHRKRHELTTVRAIHDHPAGVVLLEPRGHVSAIARTCLIFRHDMPSYSQRSRQHL